MSEFKMDLVVDIKDDQGNEERNIEQPGFLKRLLWIFTSPGKVMAALAEKPRILFALILSLVSLDALYLAHMPLYKDMLRAQTLASSGYVESMTGTALTPEMVEKALPSAVVQGLIVTPVTSVLLWLFITVIFFAILKIMGGQGKFKAYLSVTGYAYAISALYLLLALVIAQFTGNLHMDPTLTSLATLVTPDSIGAVLYSLLKYLDIFSIWYYVVLAIGLTAVSKLKKKNVYIAVATIFLVGLVISVGLASAVSAIL